MKESLSDVSIYAMRKRCDRDSSEDYLLLHSFLRNFGCESVFELVGSEHTGNSDLGFLSGDVGKQVANIKCVRRSRACCAPKPVCETLHCHPTWEYNSTCRFQGGKTPSREDMSAKFVYRKLSGRECNSGATMIRCKFTREAHECRIYGDNATKYFRRLSG